MSAETLNIAHWITNLCQPVNSLDAWLAKVEKHLQMAAKNGMDILLAPEHMAEQWMHFCPATVKLTEELEWISAQAAIAVPRVQEMVNDCGVAFVLGSTAYRHEETGKPRNRAWMLFPDRAPIIHDKLVLTPSEQDAEGWTFETGNKFNVFEWRGFRLGLIICLDVEMPALGHVIAQQDIDLLLVPSMTMKVAGYHRVFSCARARAVELMTAVSVVGCVGGAVKNGRGRETYNGGAAVYIPSEEIFGHTGIYADIPVHGSDEGDGQVLYARNIPVKKIRDIRHGRPEAWPGPWDAGHVVVVAS
jgi:predicted amidohydrolase